MKRNIIILVSVLLSLFLMGTLSACGNSGTKSAETTTLSFKSTASYADLKKLDGTSVQIRGYMATSSPADGSFLFLMNLPYQSCPFCKPNTSQLSNTMEVYPKSGQTFGYTTQAIAVTGTLQVAESESQPFTDQYGYEFNFKIVDATYSILSDSDLSDDLAAWQKIADSGIINDIYAMYDYVNFLCAWPTYYVNSYEDVDGNLVPGYYLYASDAENFLYSEGAQYNYGYQDGYFDQLIDRIEKIDAEKFSDLIANIRKAEALADKALEDLQQEHYTYEYRYVEEFETEDYVYALDNGEELEAEMEEIYLEFTDWLGTWEL